MNAKDKKKKLDRFASRLWSVRQELGELLPQLEATADQRAVKRIMTDLAWANENCKVIGRHQMGQALDDNMGFGPSDR